MILANGTIYPHEQQSAVFAALPEKLCQTRETQTISCEQVIAALDRMSKRIQNGEFSSILGDDHLEAQVQYAASMLSRDALELKVRTELGADWERPRRTGELTARTVPLGVLLHIAAGNMDALPAWSVIEGLLTGNINILKLPQADAGLTIRFFQQLIDDAPELRDFIYIFDTPSTDIAGMQTMASFADGISVWGGDAAVTALRNLAPVGCKLIEWGHRLGFCYIAGDPMERTLFALASHIMETKGLLCSSCQVIYLDTEDFGDILRFCKRFLPILESAAGKYPQNDIGTAAQLTLRRYVQKLESVIGGEMPDINRFSGNGCSLTACEDPALELSELYGNVLVKPLPRRELMQTLRKTGGYLQTAGLICPAGDRACLTDLLFRCGVNRVLDPGDMSRTFAGEAHDGEYPLRRYVRTVNYQGGYDENT